MDCASSCGHPHDDNPGQAAAPLRQAPAIDQRIGAPGAKRIGAGHLQPFCLHPLPESRRPLISHVSPRSAALSGQRCHTGLVAED